LISLTSGAVAAPSGADDLHFDAGLEAALGGGAVVGWSGETPDGGVIDGLEFSLETEGLVGDGLVTDVTTATGGGVTMTMGGDGPAEVDQATVVPLPSGAAAALVGLGCLSARRTRRSV
jgi:hypothetical protein